MSPSRIRDRLGRLTARGTVRGDALRIYVLQFGTLALGLTGSIVVARVLGPADKGIVDLFALLIQFLTDFGSLGIHAGLLFYLANRGRPLHEVHGTGAGMSVLLGVVIFVVGWIGLPLWESILPGLPAWAVLLAFALAPTAYYRVIWQNLLVGIGRPVVSYQLGLGVSVGLLIATIALWALGALSAPVVIWTNVIFTVLATGIAFASLLGRAARLRPSPALAWNSVRFGLPLWIGLIANTINFKIDQVILNLLLDTRAVGLYAVGVRWAETLFLLDSALIAAALYRISSSEAAESYELTKRVARRQMQISGGVALLLALGAYPLILALYGPEYRESIVPLILLLPGVVSWSLAKVLSQYVVYQRGIRWLPTAFAIAGSAINIPLNFLLIPVFGIAGAAIASVCSYGVVLVMTALLFARLRPHRAHPAS